MEQETPSAVHRPERCTGERSQAVRKALRRDPYLSGTSIAVSEEEGVVTLAGTVHTWAQRIQAIKVAHHVKGVLDVADDMVVVHPSRQRRTDSQLAIELRALLRKIDDGLDDVRSTISDGWVILEGTVVDDARRDHVVKAVSSLRDVRGVRDELARPRGHVATAAACDPALLP